MQETIPLNDNYYHEDPFMVASGINETNEMSGGKSLIMPLTFTSTNTNVSPVIDLKRMTFLQSQIELIRLTHPQTFIQQRFTIHQLIQRVMTMMRFI